MLREIVILLVVALAAASKVSYENHRVFRITRETPEQMELIKQLEETNDGVSAWKKLNSKIFKHYIKILKKTI